MKVKKEKTARRYAPPPQFTPVQKPSTLVDKDLWLIQIPPGVNAQELDGRKFKLKNNKVISINETTEMLVQKKNCGHVVASEEPVSLHGQLTLRHKIEIPILNKPNPVPLADTLPNGLKYRLSKNDISDEKKSV